MGCRESEEKNMTKLKSWTLKVKVENMRSPRGNPVPNQFIIRTDNATYFQSYQTMIAVKTQGRFGVYLDRNAWDYSRTTGKYRNIFLGETKRETEQKIKSGEYILTNLN